jgi:transposase-like protein
MARDDLLARRYDRNPLNALRVTLTPEERAQLIAARRERKLRLKVLARLIGVHPNALLHWQAGRRRPTPEHFAAWRDAVL